MELVEPDSFHEGKVFYDFTPVLSIKKAVCTQDSDKMDYYDGKLNHLWVDLFILDKLQKERQHKKSPVSFIKPFTALQWATATI